MRILIGTYELFNGPAADWALSNLRAPFQYAVEEVEYVRGAETVPIPRSQAKTELSGTIARRWASAAKAMEMVTVGFQTTIPQNGLVTVEVANAAGGVDRYYLDGAFTMGTPSHIGCRTFLDFNIVGGAFRKTQNRV